MNQIERLYKNIKAYVEAGAFDSEFDIFIKECADCDSIEALNDIMESEMSYWEDGDWE